MNKLLSARHGVAHNFNAKRLALGGIGGQRQVNLCVLEVSIQVYVVSFRSVYIVRLCLKTTLPPQVALTKYILRHGKTKITKWLHSVAFFFLFVFLTLILISWAGV